MEPAERRNPDIDRPEIMAKLLLKERARYKYVSECSIADMPVSYTHLTLPTILRV